MNSAADEAVRSRIVRLLSGALNPAWTERALSQESVDAAIRALQALRADDLVGKLVTAGFTLHPYVPEGDEDGLEHSCATCIYYERNRRFCSLPELMLPVEARWSCIVWRI